MSPRAWQIAAIVGSVLIVLLAGLLLFNYRAEQVAAESYQVQAARSWTLAAGGFNDFSEQVLSLKTDASSMPAVCHNAKVQLQNLNKISLTGDVPEEHRQYQNTFNEAVQSNRRYYRKILDLCSGQIQADSSTMSSVFTLGQTTEDKYRQAGEIMPDSGTEVESGTAASVNERLASVASSKTTAQQPSRPQVSRPRESPPQIREVPRRGYTPDFPPAIGSVVIVETPRGGPLNLREYASLSAPKVEERETVEFGERVMVLDREGYWLYVVTEDRTYGYIRWWYEGTSYVKP